MRRNSLSLLRLSVAFAATLAVQQVPRTYGNDAMAPASNEGVESLRREVYDLTRLLRAQQEQMNQQTARLEQFQHEMHRQAAEIQRIPPVDTRISATPISSTTEFFEPGGACDRCAPHSEPCDRCGGSNGCGCDPLWWDIGGQYRVMFNSSNFDWHARPDGAISDNQRSQTFINQRFRTWLEVHPNDNVQGYLQVEIGHNTWGSDWDFPKSYPANRWPSPIDQAGDRVGIEMRRAWVQYQNERVGRLRVGIQGWQDSFGQVLASSDWDFDVGGLSWQRTLPALGNANMLLGLFALNEGDYSLPDDSMLFTLDLDWELSQDTSVGFSAYYLPDNGGDDVTGGYSYPMPGPYPAYASAWDAWLGLRATTQMGRVPLNAFFIYNPGQRKDLAGPTFVHEGVAFKFAAGPVPAGPGEASFQALYSTGNSNQESGFSREFRTIAQSDRDNFGAEGYWSYLVITSAYGPADVNDLGVSLQNRGFGLITLQGKYAFPISQRLSGEFAAGWLRSDTPNWNNGGTELGTELVQKFSFDFGGGLIADFGFAYLFTGDFYRAGGPAGPQPDDLWEAYTRLQLEF